MSKQVSKSRIYTFNAAHRLNSQALSERENVDVYDKCNNPFGHGHNYELEITVTGTPDSETGTIIPNSELDSIVNAFLGELNYKHLDNEVPYFKERISSGENIIQFLWTELDQRLGKNMLYHIKLWETNNNYFELGKE